MHNQYIQNSRGYKAIIITAKQWLISTHPGCCADCILGFNAVKPKAVIIHLGVASTAGAAIK
eukprot:scaffold677823_cov59-Prasinocladus_malaysianus.AAC.1